MLYTIVMHPRYGTTLFEKDAIIELSQKHGTRWQGIVVDSWTVGDSLVVAAKSMRFRDRMRDLWWSARGRTMVMLLG